MLKRKLYDLIQCVSVWVKFCGIARRARVGYHRADERGDDPANECRSHAVLPVGAVAIRLHKEETDTERRQK